MTLLAWSAIRVLTATTDTVWVRETPPDAFSRITSIATALVALIVLGILLVSIPTAWRLRTAARKAERLFQKTNVDLAPLIAHARAIADNVQYISTVIRDDVGTISATVRAANMKLEEAISVTERQVHDFGALLAVVQQEAEGVFVATAATVRGVRMGASHFAGDGGPELASVEPDGDDPGLDEDDEDSNHGNDGFTDDDADATRGPRVIRRRAPR
jgi:hypothetical protein